MSQQPSKASKLMIYIAGVPSVSTKAELIEYFQEFGKIKSIESRFCRGENTRNPAIGSPSKVYWLLEAQDQETYASILNFSPCIFQDRKLYLAPFKSGIDLVMHNNSIAKKRVLVKKVPRWLPEHSLIKAIEKGFGPVDTFFKFESDTSHPQKFGEAPKTRKAHTYSVTFKNKSDRDEVVRVGQIQLARDVVVAVEKFMHTSELRKIKQQTGVGDSVDHSKSPNLPFAKRSKIRSKAFKGIKNSAKTLDEFPSLISSQERRSLRADERLQKYLAPMRPEIYESTKPTERRYHEAKYGLVTTTDCTNLSGNFDWGLNVRFNLAQKTINRSFIGRVPDLY